MTKKSKGLPAPEKALLKKLAEAYAFIYDLREWAKHTSNFAVIERTEGIDKIIEQYRKQYPRQFQLFLNKALKKADKEKESLARKRSGRDVKGESPPGREEKAPEEKVGSRRRKKGRQR